MKHFLIIIAHLIAIFILAIVFCIFQANLTIELNSGNTISIRHVLAPPLLLTAIIIFTAMIVNAGNNSLKKENE